MDMIRHDLRAALRALRRRPTFTLVAVITLALGIGANTTIFSAVHAVVLRPLPFPDSDRLAAVYSGRDGDLWTASPPDFTDWREQNRSFEEMVAIHTTSFTLSGEAAAERVTGARVTDGFFSMLRTPPALGRAFTPEEHTVDRDRAIVLCHALWQRRFGGDPAIVGRSIRVNGETYAVVGVMPEGFAFPRSAEAWTPLAFTTRDLTTQRGAHYLNVLARLRPGVEIEAAAADMREIARRLAEEYRDSNEGWTATAETLHETVVGDVRPAMFLLLGAVGLLLLIACANVANLFLAHSIDRDRELAIRTALGAGRRRLIRTLLTESLVLAVLGGAAGLLLAFWAVGFLQGLQPGDIPRLDQIRIDGPVLLFTAGVSLLTAFVFGGLPALQSSTRRDLTDRLKAGGRGLSGHRAGRRTRDALVIAETSIAVVLVVSAGLLMRSFVQLRSVEPGFDPRDLLTFNLSLPDARYSEPEQAEEFFAALMGEVQSVPGVHGAAAVFGLPLSGFSYSISIEAIDGREPTEDGISTQVRVVTPDYFRVMGIPLLRGRPIEPSDRAGSPPVVVVNESAARLIWPDADPIGRSFELGTGFGLDRGNAGGQVIGIVGDLKHFGLERPSRPEIYLAHRQFPVDFMSVVVRTADDPAPLTEPIRARLEAIDPEIPMFRVQSMEQLLSLDLAQPRFYMMLLAVFGAAALTLAAVGIYGVIAYAVAGRTREIGIRIALGARERDVLADVLLKGLGLAAAGLLIGVIASLGAARLLSGLLFGVEPTDAPTLIGVVLLLMMSAFFASYLPARRATRVDPVTALREE